MMVNNLICLDAERKNKFADPRMYGAKYNTYNGRCNEIAANDQYEPMVPAR